MDRSKILRELTEALEKKNAEIRAINPNAGSDAKFKAQLIESEISWCEEILKKYKK